MGRGGQEKALQNAKSLLYGPRRGIALEVKTKQVKQRKTSGHKKFAFSKRRLGIDNSGLLSQNGWYGTSYWGVKDNQGSLLAKFKDSKKESNNYAQALEGRNLGKIINIDLGPVEETGEGHSTPHSPRYTREIKTKDGQTVDFNANADFVEVVERCASDGYWRFNTVKESLLYFDNQSKKLVGVVLPRRKSPN